MKKKIKVLIALVVIACVALGAYFILSRGTDNKQIYAKVYGLNNEMIVDDENIYKKINETLVQMIDLIEEKNYAIENVTNDFKFITSMLNDYSLIKEQIENNSLFISKNDTNPYYKNMNNAYSKLNKLYKDGYDYLKDTHYAITNSALYNKDYIENFHNIFKDVVVELNNFYVNAGLAFVYGTQNTMDNNNNFKLEVEYYCFALNHINDKYVELTTVEPETVTPDDTGDNEEGGAENSTGVSGEETPFNIDEFINTKNELINGLKNEISKATFDNYMLNKAVYDTFVSDKKLNKDKIASAYLAGTINEYVEGLKTEEEKSKVQEYINYIIEG